MVLRLLARRGVPVDERAVATVLACEDASVLDVWFDRATVATRADEVLGSG
jgi:hypothetical protein